MVQKAADDRKIRFGVCGTGYWAELVHLPVLRAGPEYELVGVYGRSLARTRALAAEFDIRPFASVDEMFGEVDAISFAVPPNAQAGLATRAARDGKHLILEKPLATSIPEADGLVSAIASNGVISRVFLTRLFIREAIELIERARATAATAGSGQFRSAALLPGSPYADSAWRREPFGPLWDVGPHVLSMLVSVFGPVRSLTAAKLRDACFDCHFEHLTGARSRMTVDLMDREAEVFREHYKFCRGNSNVAGGPFRFDRSDCFATAARSLASEWRGLPSAGPDAYFGRDLVVVLEAARASVESGSATVVVRA